jgi:hypothetical protein
MKTCPNCRTIHPDDYMGTCQDCGKGLGSVLANATAGGRDSLAERYARQRRLGDAEASLESAFRRGEHGSVRVDERVMDAALSLLQPKPGAFTDE